MELKNLHLEVSCRPASVLGLLFVLVNLQCFKGVPGVSAGGMFLFDKWWIRCEKPVVCCSSFEDGLVVLPLVWRVIVQLQYWWSSCLEWERGYNCVQYVEMISTFKTIASIGCCFLFWFQNSVCSITNVSSVWECNAECSWLLYTLRAVCLIMWSLYNWVQVAVEKISGLDVKTSL